MHKVFFRVLSSPRITPLPLRVYHAHHVSSPSNVTADLVIKMRDGRVSALANIHNSNKAELARAVETSMRDFLFIASSKQKSMLNAMDAIGLIKLCRKSSQSSRIADIWPHIQQLSLLPAKDGRTSCALIGSVVSSALEAQDSATAASVWEYLRSSPCFPLQEAVASQLLSALRGRPDLVVELITALQQGKLCVRANVQHFAVALGALVDAPNEAKRVFEHALQHKQVDKVTLVVWCQILRLCKDLDGALDTLSIADSLSITPEQAHYTVLLSCAADIKNLLATQHIHQHLLSHLAVRRDNILTGALVYSYARCGDLETAVSLFEAGLRSGLRFDVKEWNCLLSAYTEHGMMKEAQATFERMIAAGVPPDEVTYIVLVHSCAQCGDLETAVSLFEAGLRSGLLFGVKEWNCLLSAYTEYSMMNEAQATFERMTAAGVAPDEVTCIVLLSAAAEMKSLSVTKRIHQHLLSHSAMQRGNILTGALVHSYAQCGDLETAVSLFEEGLRSGLLFAVKEWTCLLSAYTEHGMMNEAQATFERMIAAGVAPSEVTVLCLLNVASHAGLGPGVRQLYGDLQARFPALQLGPSHRTCVVDGLARAGLLDEAVTEARALEDFVPWVAVLGGARSHGRLDIGELALKELRRFNPDNATLASAHVLMSHIYTAHGRDEEAAQIRRTIKNKALRKLPGESSIEVSGVMHAFRVGDTSHPEMQQIVAMNDELHERLRAAGYVPDIAWASRDASTPDQTKEQLLCKHSERLALVYGLLHSAEGHPLTIFKNLRVCGDCHNATKHASKVLARKLVVKDMNRWHVFEDGKCSCGDFW